MHYSIFVILVQKSNCIWNTLSVVQVRRPHTRTKLQVRLDSTTTSSVRRLSLGQLNSLRLASGVAITVGGRRRRRRRRCLPRRNLTYERVLSLTQNRYDLLSYRRWNGRKTSRFSKLYISFCFDMMTAAGFPRFPRGWSQEAKVTVVNRIEIDCSQRKPFQKTSISFCSASKGQKNLLHNR